MQADRAAGGSEEALLHTSAVKVSAGVVAKGRASRRAMR